MTKYYHVHLLEDSIVSQVYFGLKLRAQTNHSTLNIGPCAVRTHIILPANFRFRPGILSVQDCFLRKWISFFYSGEENEGGKMKEDWLIAWLIDWSIDSPCSGTSTSVGCTSGTTDKTWIVTIIPIIYQGVSILVCVTDRIDVGCFCKHRRHDTRGQPSENIHVHHKLPVPLYTNSFQHRCVFCRVSSQSCLDTYQQSSNPRGGVRGQCITEIK